MQRLVGVAVALSLVLTNLSAQQELADPNSDLRSAASEELPTIPITITSSLSVVGALGPAFALPLKCSPNGTIVLRFATAMSVMDVAAVKVDGSVTRFGMDRISDLHMPRAGSFFPTDKAVLILARTTVNVRSQRLKIHKQNGEEQEVLQEVGDERQYITRFDWNGQFVGMVRLDVPFHIFQFGEFADGYFLVSGIDRDKNEPVIALLRPNGQLERYVTVTNDITASSIRSGNPIQISRMTASPSLESALATSEIVADGPDLLLVRRQQDAPIFEVDPSGDVRQIAVKPLVKGAYINSVRSTPAGWLVQFTKQGRSPEQGFQIYNALVDRSSGKSVSRYSVSAPIGLGWGCPADDRFIFLKATDNGIQLLVGEVNRSAAAAPK